MKHSLLLSFLLLMLLGTSCRQSSFPDLPPRETQSEGYVWLNDKGRLMLNQQEWFPLMVNYKVDWRRDGDTIWLAPAYYYNDPNSWDEASMAKSIRSLQSHMFLINQALGANAVRICLDVVGRDEKGYFYGQSDQPIYLIADSSSIFRALEMTLDCMKGWLNLRAMLLLKPPLDEELTTFTAALLQHFSNDSSIWAYDFMNEPLYFDPAKSRSKGEAYQIASRWRAMMESHAPHQLFTIGFAEPIEVFEWDPSLLPVDFVEVHTYHPLRVASEMYWYGHYCGKPWMVGETALPADNDSVPYEWQRIFMQESFQCAIDNGAIGYGWWEFQDCLQGVNFEAQYTGLLNHDGSISMLASEEAETPGGPDCRNHETPDPDSKWTEYVYPHANLKPAATRFATLNPQNRHSAQPPVNYHNMLGYSNIKLCGKVVDKKTGQPIEGAVVRGWNDNWSVGINTFTDADGNFTLYSNDLCVHFEVSAPGCSHLKFDRQNIKYSPKVEAEKLPHRDREYQQIDYREFLTSQQSMLTLTPHLFNNYKTEGSIGTIKLQSYQQN